MPNAAHGLAQVMRTGWFREAATKGEETQTFCLLLVTRAQLVSQCQAIANTSRGLLKTLSHVVRRGAGDRFTSRVDVVS